MNREYHFCQGLTAVDIDTLARFGIKMIDLLSWVGLSGRKVAKELQIIINGLIKNPKFDKRSRVFMVLINLQGACLDNPKDKFDITEKPAGEMTPIFPPAAIQK